MSWKGDFLKAGVSSDGQNLDIFGGKMTIAGTPIVGTVFGNAFYVDYRNGSDDNNGQTRNKAFKTYSAAIDACASNNNDVIYIDGDSTVVETAMVELTKNRVHTVGCNGFLGHFGQGAKIECTLASGATNIATFKNTGVRNTFTGIKFINESTVAEGLYSVVEAGEYARYAFCEFYKLTDLDETAAAELLLNGDSAQFYDCTFGSTVNIVATAKIRPCVLCSATVSGKKLRDCYFENCLFLRKAGGTASTFVYGANATDVERMLMFKDCTFFNNPLSAATPAHAVGFASAQTVGAVFLKNCSSVDCDLLVEAAVGIYVDGAVPTFASSGVSVAS